MTDQCDPLSVSQFDILTLKDYSNLIVFSLYRTFTWDNHFKIHRLTFVYRVDTVTSGQNSYIEESSQYKG